MKTRRLHHPSDDPTPPWPVPVLAEPNRVNVYIHKDNVCRQRLITIDLHVGTTPFQFRCKCGRGLMTSCMYVDIHESLRLSVTHEWYVPPETERRVLAKVPGMIAHIMRGGLLLRPILQETHP